MGIHTQGSFGMSLGQGRKPKDDDVSPSGDEGDSEPQDDDQTEDIGTMEAPDEPGFEKEIDRDFTMPV